MLEVEVAIVLKTAELIHVACTLCGASNTKFERELAGFTLQRCTTCSFVYTNPRPTEAQLTEHYSGADGEQLIAHYARVVTPSVLDQYRKTLDRIERVLPCKGRLLDLACAAGYFYEQAGLRGWEAHGADLGEWAMEAARRRGLANMHIGSLSEIAFPPHHFDVVHSAQMLEHLANPSAILEEVKRILRPGGVLYVDVPNYHTLSIRLGRDDFWLNKPPEHLNFFTPRTLKQLLVQNGFTGIQLSSSGGLKWENILGGRIRRDVALGSSSGAASLATGLQSVKPPRRSIGDRLHSVAKVMIVEPLFYKWLKSGMCLSAIARLP